MTKYTHNYSLPYPEGNDAVAVHTDIEDLAKRVDMVVPAETTRLVEDKFEPIRSQVHTHEQQLVSVRQGEEKSFRITDRTGAVAFEVDAQGRTHIYDAISGGGATPSITEWHVFLAAGQSNMSGSGRPFSDELDPPDPRVLQYGHNNRTIRPATAQLDMHNTNIAGVSPALGFAREYVRQSPQHVGVLLVPAARSGTNFNSDPETYTWRPGAASAPEWDLYGLSVQQTLEALENIGSAGQLKGILWHQGEGNSSMTTEEYATELDALIQEYRTDLDDPELPFMVGQMAQERFVTLPLRQRVDRAHYETPARVQRTGFAPSDWGWASYDETHFGRDGALTLGKRFVTAYYQALANVEGAQILPPLNVSARRVGDQVTVTWDAPTTRVTGYNIRTRPIGSETWEDVTRESDMKLSETFDTTGPVEIEVTSTNGTDTSTNVLITA